MKKLFALTLTASLAAATVFAAPQRPAYTTESRVFSRAALTRACIPSHQSFHSA